MSLTHATFVITRDYKAPPARVFAAWAKADQKRQWFACHGDWISYDYTLDFRVGGKEINRTGPAGGAVHAYDATYLDIVPNERLVLAYAMRVGDRLLSLSLETVEFAAHAGGTRLTFTEQGAFLDGGGDIAEREEGTRIGLDAFGAWLDRTAATAA